MTTLQFRPKTRKRTPSALVASIQGKVKTRWDAMKDSEVLDRAQMAVDKTGIADSKSFKEVFRGISLELSKRGLFAEDLDFSFNNHQKPVQLPPGLESRPWAELSDEEFTLRSRKVIKEKGISDWETFKNVCRGIVHQLFKRELPREELGFSS